MQIIFLDIDGVLNNYESCKKRKEYFDRYNIISSSIDEGAIRRLAKITNITRAKIVLTSWRRGDFADGVDNVKRDESKNLVKLFNKYHIEIIGVTRFIPKSEDEPSWRELEINHFLDIHPEIDTFVIIDDESLQLCSLQEFLVKTETLVGLQDEHVEKAIEILTSKKFDRRNRRLKNV